MKTSEERARTLAIEALAGGHPDFVPLSGLRGIGVDLRYASPNNFVGADMYSPFDCAWLHREAAAALAKSARWLADNAPGHSLLVLDALRPQRVQERMWKALEGTGLQIYLADPARGSIHSFGMAVDVTLLDAHGSELDMGTGFDDLTERSHPALEEGLLLKGALAGKQVENRRLLRAAMSGAGWQGIRTEWWHFDAGDRERVRSTFLRIL